jgi:toxin ParE1/3/4
MAEIRWTLQAANDLEAIVEFIAADSRHYAQLLAINVLKAVDRLAGLPRSGRIVPELGDSSIREIILGNYRVIYRVRQDVVEILAVYHGARMLDPSRLK